MAENTVKENLSKEGLRGAIQFLSAKGWSVRKIAIELRISTRTVQKWKNRESTRPPERQRKGKLTADMKLFIFNEAVDKSTGREGKSSRKITISLNNKFKCNISYRTVNNYLLKVMMRPRRIRSTFILTEKHKYARYQFAKYIIDNGIKGNMIFFTDEKRFCLDEPLNPQNNQIRLSRESYEKLRKGDRTILSKVQNQTSQYPRGVMVAAGICGAGVGKLNFCIGTMNSFSYAQALDNYKDDLNRLGLDLHFQQDNAPSHTSKSSLEKIEQCFNKVLKWPPHSPDISPIETLWAIVQAKKDEKKYSSLDEMRVELVSIWNRIPPTLCERLCNSFDKKILNVYRFKGERYYPIKEKKMKKKEKEPLDWSVVWNENEEIENIIYNEETLEKHRIKAMRHIRSTMKRINQKLKKYRRQLKPAFLNKIRTKKGMSHAIAYEKLRNKQKGACEIFFNCLEEEINLIETMSITEYYEHLPHRVQLKLLAEKIPRDGFVNISESNSTIEETTYEDPNEPLPEEDQSDDNGVSESIRSNKNIAGQENETEKNKKLR